MTTNQKLTETEVQKLQSLNFCQIFPEFGQGFRLSEDPVEIKKIGENTFVKEFYKEGFLQKKILNFEKLLESL